MVELLPIQKSQYQSGCLAENTGVNHEKISILTLLGKKNLRLRRASKGVGVHEMRPHGRRRRRLWRLGAVWRGSGGVWRRPEGSGGVRRGVLSVNR